MGILGKITRNDKEEEKLAPEPVCAHTALTPKWINPNDFGKSELATYTCEACGETLTNEQARTILDPSRHTPNLPVG